MRYNVSSAYGEVSVGVVCARVKLAQLNKLAAATSDPKKIDTKLLLVCMYDVRTILEKTASIITRR